MKSFAAVLLIASVGAIGRAQAEQVIVAAMAWSEQRNYTWIATVSDDAQTYEIEGKIELGGYAWVRQPMVRTLARRLGRTADPRIEAYFRNGLAVLRTADGWRTVDELPRSHEDWRDEQELLLVRGSSAPSIWNPTDPYSLPLPAPVLVLRGPRRREQHYSNVQFGLSAPHEELAVIVCSYTSLQVSDQTATGTLSDIGAQLLLVRDGQEDVKPIEAAGAFELTISDGRVTRYDLRLEGILAVGRKKVHVQQASRTVMMHAGATRLEVPDEVRLRLGP